MWKTIILMGLSWILLAGRGEARKADPTKVDSFLTAASDTTRDLKVRMDLAKEAVAYDRSGQAMHALARLYLVREKLAWRLEAERWIKEALRREPDNADYRATCAEMFWKRRSRPKAYEQARQAIELDPNHVRGLYWAGRYVVWSWEMAHYTEEDGPDTTRVGQESAVTGKTFHHREYTPMDPDTGIDLLGRALSVDPVHQPSLLLLGLFYYELKRYNPLVALFEAYLERRPEDADAYFFKGLGHQAQGRLQAAYQAYVAGLDRMAPEAQRFVQSVFMLVDNDDPDMLPNEATLAGFWKGRDPLFMTPVNERLMEHCRRVAYATLRFGDPTRSAPGWRTDRGQVYIRYGRPRTKRMVAGEIDLGLDRLPEDRDPRIAQGQMPYTYTPRTETWGYDEFEVTFQVTTSWDSWLFQRAWDGQRQLGFKDLVEWMPESYQHPWLYVAPRQIAQFRDHDGKTRVEIYYALPADELTHREAGPGMRDVDLRKGLFLFDAAWDTVRQEIFTIKQMPWVGYDRDEAGYLLWGERLSLQPGVCRLVLEAQDRSTKRTGTFRDSLFVRRFGTDTLNLSDVLLARQVVEQEDRPFGRDQYMVLPNPLKQCSRNRQAWFYFEVYNLDRDTFGATHYRISYQMRRLPETSTPGEPVPEWTTAVAYTFRRSRPWEPHHLALDLKDTAPGIWAFRVVVDDLETKAQAMASTKFRVMW